MCPSEILDMTYLSSSNDEGIWRSAIVEFLGRWGSISAYRAQVELNFLSFVFFFPLPLLILGN